jgi:ATP-dependent helicase HepA
MEVLESLHFPQNDYSELITRTKALHLQHLEALQQGRDRLLEFNSCRPKIANQLKADALGQDQDSVLQQYMESVFDCFGVDYEIHSEKCYVVHAGTHMLLPFPSLPEEGMTVTYDRETALAYEDMDYITWDHPLVVSAMEMIQVGEIGNTAVVATAIPGVSRGTIVLESIFILESASTDSLQSSRYLPPTTIRIMIDQTGKRLDHLPSYRAVDTPDLRTDKLKPEMAKRILKVKQNLLRKMVSASENFAQKLAPRVIQTARDKSARNLNTEINRLKALISVNPNVRQEEIDFYTDQLLYITKRLDDSNLRLDALRVIVAT